MGGLKGGCAEECGRDETSGKAYSLWALGVGGVALIVGVWVSVELLLALMGLVGMPPWLWLLARCLAVATWLCFGATGVLLAMSMSKGFREWVESGVGRCGRWIGRLL